MGSASPTGRMPQERSRLPIHVDGSTAISVSSTRIHPDHDPSWAKRCASNVIRLPLRITCGNSCTTSNSPFHVRSKEIPSVVSRVRRIVWSGSITSMR
ncbi:Uncharacterised protein [Mycobacteroides abscessus subsp. abscessus]|nr:Uncharacterised protein [Mycobacteroides abscessus subsp. abscessus]